MRVRIDQDLCTGGGLCEEIVPAVFALLEDGLSYVREDGRVPREPGGAGSTATVPDGMEAEAADEYPGECIFIEADSPG